MNNKILNKRFFKSTKEHIKEEKNTTRNIFKFLFKYIIFFSVVIILLLLALNKVVFILHVPSESMEPTLNVNEDFLTKVVSPNDDITYGIYGFYSEEQDTMMVKRIIGLPGDKIEFVDGVLYRNNKLVKEDYVLYNDYYNTTFEVPEGKYLMLGDNRVDSFDARYWVQTYIPRKDIVGKVLFRIRPFFRIGFVE